MVGNIEEEAGVRRRGKGDIAFSLRLDCLFCSLKEKKLRPREVESLPGD